MKRRFTALALVAVLLSGSAVAPAAAAAAQQTDPTSIPIQFTSDLGSFTGTLDVIRFVVRNNTLQAVGVLSGTVTTAAGQVEIPDQLVTLPVLNISATCQILHLELGPLDLNLLGLVIHLDRVVLDITAQSGPGNLLGNLLCALAGLLDSDGALRSIANLLNQILRILG